MDAQQEWAAEQRAAVRRQRLVDEERAEVRADAARLAEVQARHDAMWDACRRSGRPAPSHADVLSRAREALDAEDGRDAAMAYGSSARPAVWWTRADGSLVEVSARPTGVARSASEAADDALLAHAKAMQADTFMKVQIARAESRRKHRAVRAQEAPVSRVSGEWDGGYPVISR